MLAVWVPSSLPYEVFAELYSLNEVALNLYGGEEYELVFTVKPDCVDEARTELRSVGAELIELGVVTKESDELAR